MHAASFVFLLSLRVAYQKLIMTCYMGVRREERKKKMKKKMDLPTALELHATILKMNKFSFPFYFFVFYS